MNTLDHDARIDLRLRTHNRLVEIIRTKCGGSLPEAYGMAYSNVFGKSVEQLNTINKGIDKGLFNGVSKLHHIQSVLDSIALIRNVKIKSD